jgi:2-polyprenyl-3-methyl-5-hydroxy-6-metoxy-1,4-benzoquinol methylase
MLQNWPKEHIEFTGHCPICSSKDRVMLYDNLSDSIFFIAPGKWCLWSCLDCESGYLDPRPDIESIPLAYEEYYTHANPNIQLAYAELTLLKKIRRKIVNGYINYRYGSNLKPSSFLGIVVCKIFPFLKRSIDSRFRNLPARKSSLPLLLDLGCGSGTFLKDASSCGWVPTGIDIDEKAIQCCKENDLQAEAGTIDYFEGQFNKFQFITMDHVIEHLHNPLATLSRCFDLLQESGELWIQTPNIKSFGHQRYGKSWRGLEVPRHLTIFNHDSLKGALIKTGFSSVQFLKHPDPSMRMFAASYAVAQGISPYSNFKTPISIKLYAIFNIIISKIFSSNAEFITVIAKK